jgi:hypothetical protein
MNRKININSSINWILTVLAVFFLLPAANVFGQKKNKAGNNKAAFHTGKYRNLFAEAGYSQDDIDKKIQKAYYDVFDGPNHVYFEVNDSMAYVSDVKNKDARTEGLSYGMMIAVQLDKKDVFDKIWRWAKKYVQHQDGPREAYFAWSFNPVTMKQNSPGSASDGELYFVTSLLFASNKWGNKTGINYYGEARRILDAMWKKKMVPATFITSSIRSTNKYLLCRKGMVINGRILLIIFPRLWRYGHCMLKMAMSNFTKTVQTRHAHFCTAPAIRLPG